MRTLKTFQCTHILGASRGLLCDSSAVLFNVILQNAITGINYELLLNQYVLIRKVTEDLKIYFALNKWAYLLLFHLQVKNSRL